MEPVADDRGGASLVLQVNRNGRLTLPAELLAKFAIEPDDRLEVLSNGDQITLLLPPVNKRPKAYNKLLSLAMELFDGNACNAALWLHRPQYGLGGEVPVRIMRTRAGAKEMQKLICRIAHGVYA